MYHRQYYLNLYYWSYCSALPLNMNTSVMIDHKIQFLNISISRVKCCTEQNTISVLIINTWTTTICIILQGFLCYKIQKHEKQPIIKYTQILWIRGLELCVDIHLSDNHRKVRLLMDIIICYTSKILVLYSILSCSL